MVRNRLLKLRLLAPGLSWVVIFFVVPFVLVLLTSFTKRSPTELFLWWPPTLQQYGLVFQASHLNYFFNSIVLSLLTTLFCAFLAYPVALFLTSLSPRRKLLFLMLLLLPLFTNYLVRLFAMTMLLRSSGPVAALGRLMGGESEWLGTSTGVLIGMVYVSLPLMILPLFSSIDKIDRAYLEAAYDLGAKRRQVFFNIIFPLSKKGLLAGSLFVMIPNLGELLVPRVLGGGKIPVLGMLIEDQFLGRIRSNWPLGAALTVVLTLVIVPAVFLETRSDKSAHKGVL